MTAIEAIEYLKSIPAEEPVFVLRAQDFSADQIVDKWVYQNAERLGWNHPKVVGAEAVAKQMRAWPTRKNAD